MNGGTENEYAAPCSYRLSIAQPLPILHAKY